MSSMVVYQPNSSVSSSCFTPPPPCSYKYDVFLSFRGEDTRDNFIDHLHKELRLKGIHTFMDDKKLETGKEIGSELLKAIEQSRFSIVVLSRNYASSRWCLNELVNVLKCNTTTTTTIYPVFYHVDPSEVRNQTRDFGKGLEDLLSKYDSTIDIDDQVQMWTDALKKVGNLKGWPYPCETIIRSETKFIEELVRDIFSKLDHPYSMVTEYLVGMDSRVEKVIELLGLGLDDCDEALAVGIWGMGGIGKTTVAKAVCDHISSQFEGCSFIENVRENSKRYRGVETLQEKLISDILMEVDFKVGDIYHGRTMIQNRVGCKKVLLVLDDVDCLIELENIFGDLLWSQFHPKSRIMITTRDLHKLKSIEVRDIYKVEELGKGEAVELFMSKAFGKHHPTEGFEEVLDRAVEHAKGLPLALKVLGSSLKGRSKGEWASALNRLRENKLRESDDDKVERVLKISYDALGREDKKIFLDIACFFKGKHRDYVTKILDNCGFNPKIGITNLVNKSLVTISEENEMLMHDLIQQLGWNIVFDECPEEPGERSRLWLYIDIKHVLEHNTGTNKVEGIVLEDSDIGQLSLSPKTFAKMTNLRILKIRGGYNLGDLKCVTNKLSYLEWYECPLKYMPSTFRLEHLVELHITYSAIEQLWKGAMPFHHLKVMNLSDSAYLTESPDFTGAPKLEKLILEDCTSLVNLHPSIGDLGRLILLNLSNCKNLESLPIGSQLESLEELIVIGCSKLKIILGSFEHMKRLSKLDLSGSGIEDLPPSVGNLTNLRFIDMGYCKNLRSIPNHIGQLKGLSDFYLDGSGIDNLPQSIENLTNLCWMDLTHCENLRSIPNHIGQLKHLSHLYLGGSGIEDLPQSVVNLTNLRLMDLGYCKNLRSIPNHIGQLTNLRELFLGRCNLKFIPSDICSLYSLGYLDLSGNNFESLPSEMNQLIKLYEIKLCYCKKLQEIPELSSKIQRIYASGCESLTRISYPFINPYMKLCNFENCLKLVENGRSNILLEEFLANQFQRGSRPEIVISGSEISERFNYQSMGPSVSFQLPPHWYNRMFLGFAFSFVAELQHQQYIMNDIIFSVKIGDKNVSTTLNLYPHCVRSSFVWTKFIPFDSVSLATEDLERFNDFGIEITAYLFEEKGKGRVYFLKSGARVIYMEDQASSVHGSEELDRSR